MDSYVIDHNPATGITESFHWDDAEGLMYLALEQDVTDILEANRALYDLVPKGERWGEGRRVATIPTTLWMKLRKDGILSDPKAFNRWLNDPDNRAFRTSPGVL